MALDPVPGNVLHRIETKLDLIHAELDRIAVHLNRTPKVPGDRPMVSTDVRQVFEYWVSIMGKVPSRTKLTPERRRLIQARLRDGYSVEDMNAAIAGCFHSDFHMARGGYRGGTKYNDLTLILRNGSKLEGFRDGKAAIDKGAFL